MNPDIADDDYAKSKMNSNQIRSLLHSIENTILNGPLPEKGHCDIREELNRCSQQIKLYRNSHNMIDADYLQKKVTILLNSLQQRMDNFKVTAPAVEVDTKGEHQAAASSSEVRPVAVLNVRLSAIKNALNGNPPLPNDLGEFVKRLKDLRYSSRALYDEIHTVVPHNNQETIIADSLLADCEGVLKTLDLRIDLKTVEIKLSQICSQLKHKDEGGEASSTIIDELQRLRHKCEELQSTCEVTNSDKCRLLKDIHYQINREIDKKFEKIPSEESEKLYRLANSAALWKAKIQSEKFPDDSNLPSYQSDALEGLLAYHNALCKERNNVYFIKQLERRVDYLEELIEDFKITSAETHIENFKITKMHKDAASLPGYLQSRLLKLVQRVDAVEEKLPDAKKKNEERMENFLETLETINIKLLAITPDVDNFADVKEGNDYYRLNETLIREILKLDNIDVHEGKVYDKKIEVLKYAQELSATLNEKGNEYESISPAIKGLDSVTEWLSQARNGSEVALNTFARKLSEINNFLLNLPKELKHYHSHKDSITERYNLLAAEYQALLNVFFQNEMAEIERKSQRLSVLSENLKIEKKSDNFEALRQYYFELSEIKTFLETLNFTYQYAATQRYKVEVVKNKTISLLEKVYWRLYPFQKVFVSSTKTYLEQLVKQMTENAIQQEPLETLYKKLMYDTGRLREICWNSLEEDAKTCEKQIDQILANIEPFIVKEAPDGKLPSETTNL